MSLTFAGLDIHDVTGIYFDLIKGYGDGLSVRGRDAIIPSLRGRTAHQRVGDTRSLLVEGYVIGTSTADWRANTDAMLAAFDLESDPSPLIAGDPYLGLAADMQINARVLNYIPGPIIGISSDEPFYQEWSIELESLDPDWVASP